MLKKHNLLTVFFLNLFYGAISLAQALPVQHTLVAPNCLLKNVTANYHVMAAVNNLLLITTNELGIDQLIMAKQGQKIPCGGFMDVTDTWQTYHRNNLSIKNQATLFLANYAKPINATITTSAYSIKYPTQVNELLKHINPQDMWNNLTTLSNFKDRYARSENGLNAANWIKTQVETIAKNAGRNDVTTYFIPTGSYKQPSVIAKVGTGTGPGIVIGGHMDTLSSSFENKPGADDDGSGSATVLETARTLLTSGMQFQKPIYFIWYAAEEMGLVGSQYVVAEFKKHNIPVAAVMQLDMTGYSYKNDPALWLITDYVNKDLTAYLETLITTYVKQPVKYSRCGYACSDHASWTQSGYIASIPTEAAFENMNPAIHSARDTMDKLSLAHMTDFVKLATAFAVELAEPVS